MTSVTVSPPNCSPTRIRCARACLRAFVSASWVIRNKRSALIGRQCLLVACNHKLRRDARLGLRLLRFLRDSLRGRERLCAGGGQPAYGAARVFQGVFCQPVRLRQHVARRCDFAPLEDGLRGIYLQNQRDERLGHRVMDFAGQPIALFQHGDFALLLHLLRKGDAQRRHIRQALKNRDFGGR